METMQTNEMLPSPPTGVTRTELAVSGMTCSGCARNVTEAIQSVAGVDSAMVSVEQRKATVRWIAGEPVKVEAVVRAVREAGYEAEAVEARPGCSILKLFSFTPGPLFFAI